MPLYIGNSNRTYFFAIVAAAEANAKADGQCDHHDYNASTHGQSQFASAAKATAS